VRVGLAYACAWSYTRPESAPDAEAAPLAQLGTVRQELARDFAGSPVCGGLPISEGSVSHLRSVCAQKDFADTGCLYSKSLDRNTSSAFEVSAAASEPFL
jgi:hypothetical protein